MFYRQLWTWFAFACTESSSVSRVNSGQAQVSSETQPVSSEIDLPLPVQDGIDLYMYLDLGVTEVSKIDSTWDKSDSKSTSSQLRESLELKLKLD